jgi:hypothetical protein
MTNLSSTIVQRLWNYCNGLRDAVEERTDLYLLPLA